jgi:hypothetical protein
MILKTERLVLRDFVAEDLVELLPYPAAPRFTGRKSSHQGQENLLKFAQRIGDNGVPDLPEPAVAAPIIDLAENREVSQNAYHEIHCVF